MTGDESNQNVQGHSSSWEPNLKTLKVAPFITRCIELTTNFTLQIGEERWFSLCVIVMPRAEEKLAYYGIHKFIHCSFYLASDEWCRARRCKCLLLLLAKIESANQRYSSPIQPNCTQPLQHNCSQWNDPHFSVQFFYSNPRRPNRIESNLGKSGHVARQYFPYVSSESDLQRYKAIPFRQNSVNNNNDQNGSSSLSNVPSDYKSDRMKVRYTPVRRQRRGVRRSQSIDRFIYCRTMVRQNISKDQDTHRIWAKKLHRYVSIALFFIWSDASGTRECRVR